MLQWVLALALAAAARAAFVSVTHDAATGNFSVHTTAVDGWLVRANLTDRRNSTGWAQLELEGRAGNGSDDALVAFAAGLAEAHLSGQMIADFYYNAVTPVCEKAGDASLCRSVAEFLQESLRRTRERVKSAGAHDVYWRQVGLVLSQLDGLQQGISEIIPDADNMTALWVNALPEVFDLITALPHKNGAAAGGGAPAPAAGDHCSVLVKLAANGTDLLVGHATWIDYNLMSRMLKRLTLPYSAAAEGDGARVAAATMAFSGFPGGLVSQDDFTLTSAGLVTTETTLDQLNTDLWDFLSARNSVMTWVRAAVANRLATSGQEWHNTFSRHNGGAYNCQWMVVDYKKFTPGGQQARHGLLWVTEQMPGLLVGDDVTQVLAHDGYWASYNQPYFPIIDDISGNKAARLQHGDFYSYARNPRAQLFRRDHQLATNVTTAMRLMRHNNFTADPLSACNCSTGHTADSAIAARRDLNDPAGEYPLERWGFQAYGAIDAKVTSAALVGRQQFVAEAGPTHDQQPVFQWSASPFADTVRHRGQPDRWEFSPVHVRWNWPTPPAAA